MHRGVQGTHAVSALVCVWCFAEFFCNGFVDVALSGFNFDVRAAAFKDMSGVPLLQDAGFVCFIDYFSKNRVMNRCKI